MPLSTQKAQLIERVSDAIQSAGWRVIFENDDHPARILAFNDGQKRPLLVYIWKITAGGPAGVRPAGEFRIQLTGVQPPFQRSTDFQTLLLGYYEVSDIFVGFDVSRRPQMWGSSPSVQVRLSAIEDAVSRGFGFYRRQTATNAELAIAFRPEAFMDYVARQADLHLFADDPIATASLEEAAEQASDGRGAAVNLDVVAGQGRRETVRTVVERVGQQNFRARVLTVYANQCAVCSTQLNLLDAAHIVPLPGGGSNETSNGLSLCKLHHAAYDRGLLGILPDYRVTINEAEVARLRRGRRDGGLLTFRENLFPALREPTRLQDRPLPNYLTTGLIMRGWQGVVAPRI
jgi:putative restriction endonuclease